MIHWQQYVGSWKITETCILLSICKHPVCMKEPAFAFFTFLTLLCFIVIFKAAVLGQFFVFFGGGVFGFFAFTVCCMQNVSELIPQSLSFKVQKMYHGRSQRGFMWLKQIWQMNIVKWFLVWEFVIIVLLILLNHFFCRFGSRISNTIYYTKNTKSTIYMSSFRLYSLFYLYKKICRKCFTTERCIFLHIDSKSLDLSVATI